MVASICRWLFSKLDPPRPAPDHLTALDALPMAELRRVLGRSEFPGRIGRALIESNTRAGNLALLREVAVYLNVGCVVNTGLTVEESEMIRQWNDADIEKLSRLRWEL